MTTRLDEIATAAANQQPLKKADMFNLIRKIATFSLVNGDPPTEMELAKLYSFFMPKRPSATKNPLTWVKRALPHPSDPKYIYLGVLYYDEPFLYATDGHRIHRIKKTLFPKTKFYDKDFKEVDPPNRYRFPADRIPKYFEDLGPVHQKYYLPTVPIVEVVTAGVVDCWAYRFEGESGDVFLNKEYVEEAANGRQHLTFRMHDDPTMPVALLGEDTEPVAVIMPVRV